MAAVEAEFGSDLEAPGGEGGSSDSDESDIERRIMEAYGGNSPKRQKLD